MAQNTRLSQWVDMLIRPAFTVAAVSGLVLLFTGSGGYHRGRDPR